MCQANVAAAQQRCIRNVFIAIEIRKSAPGIRRQFLIDEKHLKEKQNKKTFTGLFLFFPSSEPFWLDRFVDWCVCQSWTDRGCSSDDGR